ncbi:hypothetical protein B0A81_02610 [Flavobacterium plurextorum]|uniref:Lipoprotein n=1 Tax=Flavobacterium plurextorum TaxID=1114867 RepID=A0ABX4CYY5_9FLAO|nr:hypothetical protein [Flavobacterium plurextorum]OXB10874.1 hypothetical protein B0A81_02610 [Flavobacterium plurextorum]
MIILKRGRFFLFIILFSIVINSCGKCVETNLTKEERAWFSVYEKDQTIVFKSNLGNIDSLVVTDKSETFGNKDCKWVEIGTIQNNMLKLNLRSKACKSKDFCEGIMMISKDQPNQQALPFFRIFGLEFSPNSGANKMITKKVNFDHVKLEYSDVYFFEDKLNCNSYGSNFLKSFYWDKKAGLIRYEFMAERFLNY